MTTLNKFPRVKAFPGAKVAILVRYTLAEVPKWSDIGTAVRNALRETILDELRRGENDDVADYLATHEEEADQILHKRTKSLRESRGREYVIFDASEGRDGLLYPRLFEEGFFGHE